MNADDHSEKKGILEHAELIIFYPELAKLFGICGALLIQQIHFWATQKPHVKDGYKWNYNTHEMWSEQLQVYSTRTIANTLRDLEKTGIVVVGCFNKKKYDRTHWYRVDYECLAKTLSQAYGVTYGIFPKPSGNFFLKVVEKTSAPIPKNNSKTTKDLKPASVKPKQGKTTTTTTQKQAGVDKPPQNYQNFKSEDAMANAKDVIATVKSKITAIPPDKPLKVSDLVLRWKQHAGANGEFVKPLTGKQAGQLGHLLKSAGRQSIAAIDFAFTHWDDFLYQIKLEKGFTNGPTIPDIGYLQLHHDVLLNLMKKLAAKAQAKQQASLSPHKAAPNKASGSIDKPAAALHTAEEEKPDLAMIEATLAELHKIMGE